MKLVARFWNEDGIEMPALYRAEEGDGNHAPGELVCTWNYHLLVCSDRICFKPEYIEEDDDELILREDIDRATNEGMN